MSYPNGRWPRKALRKIPGGLLAPLPARAWNAMCARCRRLGVAVPMPNGPDSSYRSFARQVFWKAWWTARGAPGNAATPGTSNHGIGKSVDSNDGGTIESQGPPFGWGVYSDAPWESWHQTHQDNGWRPPRDPLKKGERAACDELQRLRKRRRKGRKVKKRIRWLQWWLYLRARALAEAAKKAGSWEPRDRGVRRHIIVNVLGDHALEVQRRRWKLRRRRNQR